MPLIHYELPADLHRRVKVAAAQQEITLKQFVIDALTAAVEKAEKGTGRRR